jgi:hypothetical protein
MKHEKPTERRDTAEIVLRLREALQGEGSLTSWGRTLQQAADRLEELEKRVEALDIYLG